MSLPEKIYLAMVLTAFTSFAILLATLAWLDGRQDKKATVPKPSGQVAHSMP